MLLFCGPLKLFFLLNLSVLFGCRQLGQLAKICPAKLLTKAVEPVCRSLLEDAFSKVRKAAWIHIGTVVNVMNEAGVGSTLREYLTSLSLSDSYQRRQMCVVIR